MKKTRNLKTLAHTNRDRRDANAGIQRLGQLIGIKRTMTPAQYRKLLISLGWSQAHAAKLFGVTPRQSQKWAAYSNATRIPYAVELLLRLMVRFGVESPAQLLNLPGELAHYKNPDPLPRGSKHPRRRVHKRRKVAGEENEQGDT